MKFFGLISVLITVGIAIWWLTQSATSVKTIETNSGGQIEVQTSNYVDVLDSARSAAKSMER
jgi:hypothetical protein